jgi:hypothetical protein
MLADLFLQFLALHFFFASQDGKEIREREREKEKKRKSGFSATSPTDGRLAAACPGT